MSGRTRSDRGWQQPSRTPSWVYAAFGVLLTLAVVLATVVFLILGNGSGGLASASSTPTAAAGATASALASIGGGSPSPEVTPEVTPEITPEVTPQVTPEVTAPATVGPSGSQSAATKPTLVSISMPHKADCNGENVTGQVGMITITWSTTGATGVRISIDPPAASGAYGYGYADYLAPTTSAVVPFACGATLHDSGGYYHLYVVTTLHTTGYFQYRYQKIYQSPAPTP